MSGIGSIYLHNHDCPHHPIECKRVGIDMKKKKKKTRLLRYIQQSSKIIQQLNKTVQTNNSLCSDYKNPSISYLTPAMFLYSRFLPFSL